MKPNLPVLRFAILLLPALAGAQTADEIMAKVAENQTRAEGARAGFVYRQDVLVRMKRNDGKLAREEDREYTVTPEASGVKREMVHFAGKYGVDGKEVAYSEPIEHHVGPHEGGGIDADVVDSLSKDFGNDDKSRDGINQDLFPLTAKKQRHYVFSLAGVEKYHDRAVFRITFEPRKKDHIDDDGTPWAGEVLVDKADLTPVLITTHLARGVPVPVKILLGTNIQQLGFKVVYGKFDDNLWFPVNYSGELKIRVLFLYARTISLGLVNSGFQKADVKSTIVFDKEMVN
jgi:hypothetical protein